MISAKQRNLAVVKVCVVNCKMLIVAACQKAMDVSPFIFANGEALMNEVNNHTSVQAKPFSRPKGVTTFKSSSRFGLFFAALT